MQLSLTDWIGKLHLWPLLMSQRSSQVMKAPQQFLSIAFDRDMLERWKHFRCVQVGDTDRLIVICNFRAGHDIDLRSNFEVDLFRSIYSSFNASQREKDDSGKFKVILGWCQKLLMKKFPQNENRCTYICTYVQYPTLFHFLTSEVWRSSFWTGVKIVVRCWKERSISYWLLFSDLLAVSVSCFGCWLTRSETLRLSRNKLRS